MKPGKGPGNEIIEHWYSLVPSQNFSSKEIYDHVQEIVREQKVPALDVSRVDLAEGGVLSDKREYLRFKRERLTFDICAAPVGVNYFFSYRFYAELAVVRPWQIIAIIVALTLLLEGSMRVFGLIFGPFLLLVVCGYSVWFMRNAVEMGLRDIDASVMKLPVIGPVYERYFRKDTYYRQDMRIAYCSIVSAIVKQEVARVTGEKGVQLLREFTYSPAMKDLYRAKETATKTEALAEPEPANA